jgi:hypothetical protein
MASCLVFNIFNLDLTAARASHWFLFLIGILIIVKRILTVLHNLAQVMLLLLLLLLLVVVW